ncbi:MAG: NAD(P) transhydrogenase subunit beta, partial [uncultured Microvirga sp.]
VGQRLQPSLPRLRRPLHPGAARSVAPDHLPAGQPVRDDRHGAGDRDDARLRPALALCRLVPGSARPRNRRRHRGGDRPPGRHDPDAAARRHLPCRRWLGGGRGRGCGALRPASLRHRHDDGRHQEFLALRDGARRRHRGRHLHGLDHRGRKTQRQHERQADPAAEPPPSQHRARRGAPVPDLVAGPGREPPRLLAHRPRLVRARRHPHHPDRRRRHAGRGLDAQLLFGLGRRRHRLHPRQPGLDHHRRARRLVGRHPVLHHVPGHEPKLCLRHPRRVRRRNDGRLGGGRDPAREAGLGRRRRLHHEERRKGDHRAGLRHGGRPGPARAARDGGPAQERGRAGQIRHSPGRGPDARPYERAARGSQ